MSEESNPKKSHLERWVKIVGAIVVLGGFGKGILSYIDQHVDRAVKTEVAEQARPFNLLNKATALFDSEKEDEAFATLESSINLFYKRNSDEERPFYEQALHTYMWRLSSAKKSTLNEKRQQFADEAFTRLGISQSPEDEYYFAWFLFSIGKLREAHNKFVAVVNVSAAKNDIRNEGNAYEGLVQCSLAYGKLEKAHEYWKAALDIDPNERSPFIYDSNGSYERRAYENYGPVYRRTAEKFVADLEKQEKKP